MFSTEWNPVISAKADCKKPLEVDYCRMKCSAHSAGLCDDSNTFQHLVGDVAHTPGTVANAPEMAAPVPTLYFRKLL